MVSVPAIDTEHLQIHDAVEKLQAALATGARLRRMEILVSQLAEAVDDHFVNEERLLRAARYPAFEWHRRQHGTARGKLQDLAGTIQNGSRAEISRALASLDGWFRDHISVTDCMASAYLRNYERGNYGRQPRGGGKTRGPSKGRQAISSKGRPAI